MSAASICFVFPLWIVCVCGLSPVVGCSERMDGCMGVSVGGDGFVWCLCMSEGLKIMAVNLVWY
jgi:hypothetical protein